MGASSDKMFNSQYKKLSVFGEDIKNQDIKNEPMFFNSDFQFAMQRGGPITKAFLNALPLDWQKSPLVFDSRVHMLMPGWYPAIPGWHHDDVPRGTIPVGQHFMTAGQPDYDCPKYKSEHILGLVNASICPTHFAVGHCIMPKIPEGQLIYRTWHNEVEKLIKEKTLSLEVCQDRTLYYFNWETFHTGTKAVSNGWRWFGRVSRNTDRLNTITNEIRVNAQVYLEFPTEGW